MLSKTDTRDKKKTNVWSGHILLILLLAPIWSALTQKTTAQFNQKFQWHPNLVWSFLFLFLTNFLCKAFPLTYTSKKKKKALQRNF